MMRTPIQWAPPNPSLKPEPTPFRRWLRLGSNVRRANIPQAHRHHKRDRHPAVVGNVERPARPPGAFLSLPPTAYQMYHPEAWGSGVGGTLTVAP